MSFKINEIINISENFQTSVNIEFDLGNSEKISSFIPTHESMRLLEDILLSVNDNSKRARILIGAYGKGKSYIILVLLSILSAAVEDKSCYDNLILKLKEYKPELAKYAEDYIKSDKKLLPVVINGSSTSLSQSFLLALYKILKRKEFEKLMPETHFEAAIKMIDLWKSEYPETYVAFNNKASLKADKFKEALRSFDGEKYEEFETIYPQLTSGASFNALIGFDVVELYSKVIEKLPEFGYFGMYVVYDEFGKYLESSITRATVKDVKLLQDFAEKADRSKGDKQLHLLLICHKEIENYIDSLPKQKVDGWKGVNERFGHVYLHNHYSESYLLMGNAIKKNETLWNKYKSTDDILNNFKMLRGKWKGKRIFINEWNQIDTIIYECWPLHPVTSYILPRLSEKIAQNERTLFTFLSGRGAYSLYSLTKKMKEIPENMLYLVSPDVLYDYFSISMQNEPYTSDIKKVFVLSYNLLQKCDGMFLESKILKTLALIYIINQFERLQPSSDEIFDIYIDCGYSFDEVNKALVNITKSMGIVYERVSSNRFLQMKETSGVNLPQLISDTIEKRKNIVDDAEILNQINTEKYLYPVGYNSKYSMTRFYEVKFIDKLETKDTYYADGAFFALFNSEFEIDEIKNHSKINPVAIYAFPKKTETIHGLLRKYDALCVLEEQYLYDRFLLSECEVIKDDLFEGIKLFIHTYIQPEKNDCIYISDGEIERFSRKSDLTDFLTKKMKSVFNYTPVINNETLNKNTLTGQAYNSRIKLIDGILKSSDNNLGLKGSGQEVSFMRSCLFVPGILDKDFEVKKFDFINCDKSFHRMFGEIEGFMDKARKREISFQILIDKLTNSKNHIGLRKGVIPVYLAVVFQQCAKNIVIHSTGEEVLLCSEVLCDIVENPDAYTLSIISWNEDRDKYEKSLEKIFKDYILTDEKQKIGYEYLFNAILRWYRALPKYVKQTKQNVSDEDIAFMNIFKNFQLSINDSLFKKIPKAFGKKEADKEVADKLSESKKHFDLIKNELEEYLIDKTKDSFAFGKKSKQISLKNVLEDFERRVPKEARNFVFENGANKIFDVIESNTHDEYTMIENLALILTGLKIDDWSDDTEVLYFKRLTEIKDTLLNYVESTDFNCKTNPYGQNQGYSLLVKDSTGKEKKKSFDMVECSRRAKILENELKRTIEEMGQSVTNAEKRQVLIDLLEELC